MKKLSGTQILTLLLFLQIVLVKVLSFFPDFIERYYSMGIYPVISKIFRTVFGWIPFSVGDLYYLILGLLLAAGCFTLIKNKFKGFKAQIFRFGAFLSVFYFLFHVLWGLNYHRNTLFLRLDLEEREYTVEELSRLSRYLLRNVRETQMELVENDTIMVTIQATKKELLDKTPQAYAALSETFPEFTYKKVSLKKSLFSLPLTYMGFSGYYNPLSGEAQVDALVPKVSLPMINSHEVAHQLGIASESEANFIGYLAATQADDKYYNYSGYLMALRYSVGALYYKDSVSAKTIIDSIPKGVIKNIEESQNFWRSYQNKLEPFFKLFYDNYLKANEQVHGMQSYSKMVNLLVAYHEENGIE